MSTADSFGVRLKRKVLSAETKLFEWRPYSCIILAREGKLLLQLQDEDAQEEQDASTETVTIDLATQLSNVVSKKNKARCDLEYYAPAATMSRDILKEELMAPSAAQCQQWIAQVRRAQQQAHHQRRPTSSTSSRSGATPVAPLPSPLMSQVELNGSGVSRTSTTNDAAFVAVREPSPSRRELSREMSGSELAQPEVVSSSSASRPCQRSGSSSLLSSAISFTLPKGLAAAATATSCRVREHCDDGPPGINNSELDHTVDSSSGSPAPVFQPVARSISSISSVSSEVPPASTCRRGRADCVSSPRYSSCSESDMPHSPPRRSRRNRPTSHNVRDLEVCENNDLGSDDEQERSRYRRRSFRSSGISDERDPTTSRGVSRSKLTSSSLSARGSPRYRISARTRQLPGWYKEQLQEDANYEEEGESSQTELHILQRVEAALRALEQENAQAKARERELVQEIQVLHDAARVTAAELKHTEREYRHARREIDSWRRAAQSAEAAAAQLQEQLGIAREENQLLAGEKQRLKRQNNELLTQVHRLDSLVYGRF